MVIALYKYVDVNEKQNLYNKKKNNCFPKSKKDLYVNRPILDTIDFIYIALIFIFISIISLGIIFIDTLLTIFLIPSLPSLILSIYDIIKEFNEQKNKRGLRYFLEKTKSDSFAVS